ncbi:MAG: macrocin O-methyltransferase [Streptosporangiales bacterium]|nr:macrocin O-methyltransferase [Streptosporangiales bacterium]
MSGWRTRANRTLTSLTGYRLTKAPAGSPRPRATPPTKAPNPTKSAPPARPAKPAKDRFPRDFGEAERAIIDAVRPYTMTGNDKLHALITATRYIHDHAVPGAVVECGVWRGGSMQAVARTLDMSGDHSRDLYLFDTFEGMTEPSDHDTRHDGRSAAQLLAASDRTAGVWAQASLADVQEGFAQVPYPADRVHYVQGSVEETVPGEAPDRIALLRLDTDWYESTRHELDHLYPRLVSGGVLILDDYGYWKGARKATDEFLERTGERLLLIRINTGRIAVKP